MRDLLIVIKFQVYPLFLADMDSNGNLNANGIHYFHRNVKTRVVAQVYFKIKTQF